MASTVSSCGWVLALLPGLVLGTPALAAARVLQEPATASSVLRSVAPSAEVPQANVGGSQVGSAAGPGAAGPSPSAASPTPSPAAAGTPVVAPPGSAPGVAGTPSPVVVAPYAPPSPWVAPSAAPAPQPAVAPPYDPAVVAAKRTRRLGRSLTIAGWTVFGVTYAMSALAGAVVYDEARHGWVTGSNTDRERQRWGQSMAIPVVGPFVAAWHVDQATGAYFTVIAGLVQAAGVAMGIAGAVKLSEAARLNRRVQASAIVTPRGSFGSVSVRF